MIEQDLAKLLNSIQLKQTLDLSTYLIIIICSGIGAWIVSFLKENAKISANNENFENIKKQLKDNTDLIEGIRTRLSEKNWISQQVWIKRKEAYEAIFSLLFHVKKYISHQVDDHEEWEYINHNHPYMQNYNYESKSLHDLWQKEKMEYEEKSKCPEATKEAEQLKTKYEEAFVKLFEVMEVKSIYLDEKVGTTISDLKNELFMTHEYEDWNDHFNRIKNITTTSIQDIHKICKEELKIES